MKILFIPHFFPPEIGAGSIRTSYFYNALREHGMDVKVITPMPNYPEGKKYADFDTLFKKDKQLNVIYLPYFFTKGKSLILRGVSYFTYFLTLIFYSIFDNFQPDIVICSSPPITTAFASLIISKIKRAKLILDIRDIWPDIGVELGLLKNRSIIYFLKKIEKLLLDKSSKIIVTAAGDKENIINKNIDSSKIIIIYNGADTEIFKPAPAERNSLLRAEYNLPKDKKLLVYFGSFNYGMNDIKTLTESLLLLQKIASSIHFVAIGGGELMEYLIKNLENKISYTVFSNIEPSKTALIVSLCDISLVPRKFIEKDTGGNIPVKCFESWAAGVPVVLSSIDESEIVRISNSCGGGIVVRPGDANSFSSGIIELINDPQIKNKGAKAYYFVKKNFDRKMESAKLINLINNL